MVKQVTSLTTGAVATILTPGPNCRFWSVQNIGANQVNVSIDGGTTYIDTNGKAGQDPTTGATGLGYILPAGQALTSTMDVGGNSLRKPVRAIMATGTTTLNIVTDDSNSA